MHPPSPIEEDTRTSSSGVLHIIQDARNTKMDSGLSSEECNQGGHDHDVPASRETARDAVLSVRTITQDVRRLTLDSPDSEQSLPPTQAHTLDLRSFPHTSMLNSTNHDHSSAETSMHIIQDFQDLTLSDGPRNQPHMVLHPLPDFNVPASVWSDAGSLDIAQNVWDMALSGSGFGKELDTEQSHPPEFGAPENAWSNIQNYSGVPLLNGTHYQPPSPPPDHLEYEHRAPPSSSVSTPIAHLHQRDTHNAVPSPPPEYVPRPSHPSTPTPHRLDAINHTEWVYNHPPSGSRPLPQAPFSGPADSSPTYNRWRRREAGGRQRGVGRFNRGNRTVEMRGGDITIISASASRPLRGGISSGSPSAPVNGAMSLARTPSMPSGSGSNAAPTSRGPAPATLRPRNPPGPEPTAIGYPFYITQLSAHLDASQRHTLGTFGSGNGLGHSPSHHFYPLWYQILAYWFPQHEGYEIYNEWEPPVFGGLQPNIFNPVCASIAVVSNRRSGDNEAGGGNIASPVVVLQIHGAQKRPISQNRPDRSRTYGFGGFERRIRDANSEEPPARRRTQGTSGGIIHEEDKAKMKLTGERLFDDAALYSSLPALCVIAAVGKRWSGFVRATDLRSGTQGREELGSLDWVGDWEEKAASDASYEAMGAWFTALKASCNV